MEIDSQLTSRVYAEYSLDAYLQTEWVKFTTKNSDYLNNIKNSNISSHGVDFEKSWELYEIDGTYFIEYLVAGTIKQRDVFISDEYYGINIHKEERFGKAEFGTKLLLCITVIIENA